VRDRLLWLGTLVYAALFTALGALKYAEHRNLVDFGIFEQTVASAFGCFCNSVEGSHWAYHFSPILYIAGAAVWIARSPLTLIALQSLACALVALPVASIVASRAGIGAARLAALVVWLYPPLAGLAFGDFHETVFAPAAVAWMLWAFCERRARLVFIFAILTLAVKEDQSIFLAIAGGLAAWRRRGTEMARVGLAVAGVSVVVLLGYYLAIQPHANVATPWSSQRFYAWNAADVRALFPFGIAARIGFLLLAFVPLLFLPFRSQLMWLAAAPLAEVLLSRMSTTFDMSSHYSGAWIGYVLVPFALAIRGAPPTRARNVLLFAAVLCALEFAVADPLHPGLNLRGVHRRDAALDEFLHTLPQNMSVATQEEAFTHLALNDPQATLLPDLPSTPPESCFVLVDADYPQSPRLVEYGQQLQRLVNAGAYRLVRKSGAISLYASRASTPLTMRCAHSPSMRTT
jgi:uncharacterized membrane protein